MLKLRQGREVRVDGEEVNLYPHIVQGNVVHGNIVVMQPSSLWVTGKAYSVLHSVPYTEIPE